MAGLTIDVSLLAAALLCAGLVLPGAGALPAGAQEQDGISPYHEFKRAKVPDAERKLREWLSGGGDPNRPFDSTGNATMHYAAVFPMFSGRELLSDAIAAGGDCSLRNEHGETPLHFAAAGLDASVVSATTRILLNCGADPDARDGYGNTPLLALYVSVVRGGAASPSHPGVVSGRPTTGSVGAGDSGGARVEVLRALLDAGAYPNVRNASGDRPLMIAVRRKDVGFHWRDHLGLLLEAGADPDARGPGQDALTSATGLVVTPLIQALLAHDGSGESVGRARLLLEAGADPDRRDGEGDTPLIHAVRLEHPYQSVKALLDGGADPCLRGRRGMLPHDLAEEGSATRRLLEQAGGWFDRDAGMCVRDLREAESGERELGLDRDARRRVQSCLKTQGFDPGAPDGKFGPRTRGAIRALQAARGESADEATGYLTRGLLRALLESCNGVGFTPLCAGGTSAACWHELDNRPGCHMWNSAGSSDEDTITWSGGCVEGKASGKGNLVWRYRQDGRWTTNRGEGELQGGKAHGHWVWHDTGGEAWEGPYVNDEWHGRWVRRGSQGQDWVCFSRDEIVDSDHGLCRTAPADRKMQASEALSLHSGPGKGYERIGRLGADETATVTRENAAWAWVETESGEQGFVPLSALEEASRAASPAVFRDCPSCPEMVVVPAGSYMMGSRSGDDTERPVRRVTIGYDFAVGKYEVTFQEWDACVRSGSCSKEESDYACERAVPRSDPGNRRPAMGVTWLEAQDYVRWLSRTTGKSYRLLSEAEWEYAARAGSTTNYSWGDDVGRGRANCRGCGSRWDARSAAPVGSFDANAFGLHDMHGNVYEWVEDRICFVRSEYKNDHEPDYDYEGAPSDGRAQKPRSCGEQGFGRTARRGGDFDSTPEQIRSSSRATMWADFHQCGGLRVARTLTP